MMFCQFLKAYPRIKDTESDKLNNLIKSQIMETHGNISVGKLYTFKNTKYDLLKNPILDLCSILFLSDLNRIKIDFANHGTHHAREA